MKRRLVGLASVAALSAGCGSAPTHHLSGSLTIEGTQIGCSERGGYQDIAPGGAVTVTDGQHNVVAVGHLDQGKPFDAITSCIYTISVDNVPEQQFYGVAVGHRDPITYSLDDMKSANWSLKLSLGA